MGVLVNGEWRVDGEFPKDASGRFVRADAAFRDWVTADGSPGPTGEGGFAAERGRYHLYVSLACPWAHRTLIFRRLKGLEAMIGLSVVNWHLGEEGWTFAEGRGVVPDPVLGARRLHEIYTVSRPRYTGRVTVPVLFDKARGRIVNNESSGHHPHVQFGVRRPRRRARRLTIPPICAPRSTRSTRAFIRPSTTASIAAALPASRPLTTRRSSRCSSRSTRLRRGSPKRASSAAIGSPRPTGDCSPRSCASIRFMSASSSAMSGASPTIPISPDTAPNCAPGRASGRRSTSSISNSTITAAFSSSIRPELCPWGRLSRDESEGTHSAALGVSAVSLGGVSP